ncbi:MAG: tetratricopeptide repeat protein [Elainellaceae cyanobacterium]
MRRIAWGAIATITWLGLAQGLTRTEARAEEVITVERIRGGPVLIQRGVNGPYEVADEGDIFGPQDALLVMSTGVRVEVRCPNNSRGRPPVAGAPSGARVVCPDVRAARRSRDENDFLALNRGDFPYVTRLIASPRELRWPGFGTKNIGAAESGAAAYRVAIQSPDGETLWQTESRATRVAYDGPALLPGETYALVVTAGDEEPVCEDEARRQLACFWTALALLDDDALAELGSLEDQFGDTDDGSIAIALAYRYEALGLYWRVMDGLGPLVRREQAAGVYGLLGEVYLRSGWVAEAEEFYERSLRLAEDAGDGETRLAALVGLAKVAAWRWEPAVAAGYLWRSLGVAGERRDLARADVIVQWLRRLD